MWETADPQHIDDKLVAGQSILDTEAQSVLRKHDSISSFGNLAMIRDDQGRQAINFQITVLICVVAGAILLVISYGFGLVVLGLVYAWDLIMIVIAASRAWEGQHYRYPWSLTLLPAKS